MRVLVTGGAGYVGSHACKALSQAGFEPVVFDNLVYGHKEVIRWGAFEHGDILDPVRLDAVIKRHRPEVVMHFAAFAYVGESVTDPGKYYRNNVVGSLSLLEAMVRNGIDKMVFSSTCATYGTPEALPILDTSPQIPINPYGRTKLIVEGALRDYAAAHGVRSLALRYFNAAGADPEGETGESHEPETHAIPLAIQAALGQAGEFSVFGTDYATPDGTAIRDYIHVADLAQAHVKAIGYLSKREGFDAMNLGTGQGTSVLEIIRAVERATNRPVPRQNKPRRPGDPPILFADASRAQALLEWKPTHSSIDSIVSTATAWHMRGGDASGASSNGRQS